MNRVRSSSNATRGQSAGARSARVRSVGVRTVRAWAVGARTSHARVAYARSVGARSVAAIGVVAGCCLLASCGGISAATSQADATFVNTVHAEASDISQYRTNAQLILLGRATCDGFASGVSYQELADRLAVSQGSDTLSAEDLGTVISAAVQTFCPKYENLVS